MLHLHVYNLVPTKFSFCSQNALMIDRNGLLYLFKRFCLFLLAAPNFWHMDLLQRVASFERVYFNYSHRIKPSFLQRVAI